MTEIFPRYDHIPNNFGGLPAELSRFETSRVVVLPLPYDATTSYRSGTRLGPKAIIEASQNMELFDEQLHRDFSELGICTLEPVAGLKNNPQDMIKRIENVADQILQSNKFILSLGGEHSITSGLVAAYKRTYPNLNVLQIDAHLDLRDSYEGTPYNHASVMRRVLEMCPRVAVAIRSFSEEEHHYAKQLAETTFYMRRIRKEPDWIERVCAKLISPVYLTVDLDGLDPSVVPGVGTPEPGGLTWAEMMDLLEAVTTQHQVVGGDIVELIPDSNSVVSEYAAARLAYKIICFTHRGLFK